MASNHVKVTITIETDAGITSVSRQADVVAPGSSRPLVLPVLLSAVKTAAGPHLDEVAIIQQAVQLLTNVMTAVSADTP